MTAASAAFKNPLPGVPSVESPFFEKIFAALDPPLTADERGIAEDLHRHGYAVFDFPDADFSERAESIKRSLYGRFDWQQWLKHGYHVEDGLRIQDAWTFDENVKKIATNQAVLRLLSRLYGRRAWPFQTLNFPVGTQQHYHTDSVHFSSIPERFMCGVWVALEDIDIDSGPLVYYPGSHRWPIYVNEHISACGNAIQASFEPLWERLVELHDTKPVCFRAKKGQALIWAANLLHGGSRQKDPFMTRWSQVTHYYFDSCVYYTPLLSHPFAGRIHYRDMIDISTNARMPNKNGDVPVPLEFIEMTSDSPPLLPWNFNHEEYLSANPDVRAAGVDPYVHYLRFGFRERRKLAL